MRSNTDRAYSESANCLCREERHVRTSRSVVSSRSRVRHQKSVDISEILADTTVASLTSPCTLRQGMIYTETTNSFLARTASNNASFSIIIVC